MQKFHDRHGDDVTLSRGGTLVTMTGRGGGREAFSCQPLHPGDTFTVKVGEAKLEPYVSIERVVTCIMLEYLHMLYITVKVDQTLVSIKP